MSSLLPHVSTDELIIHGENWEHMLLISLFFPSQMFLHAYGWWSTGAWAFILRLVRDSNDVATSSSTPSCCNADSITGDDCDREPMKMTSGETARGHHIRHGVKHSSYYVRSIDEGLSSMESTPIGGKRRTHNSLVFTFLFSCRNCCSNSKSCVMSSSEQQQSLLLSDQQQFLCSDQLEY